MKAEYILTPAQYIAYLLAGGLYFIGIATILGIAAGFGAFALLLLFLPLIMGGLLPGLSLFRPKLAAILAIVLALPFFATCIDSWINGTPASEPSFWIIPASFVFMVSTFSILWSRESLWPDRVIAVKVILVIFPAAPLLLALYFIINIILWLASFESIPANP